MNEKPEKIEDDKDEVRKIPLSKVIYIDIDDEVSTIFDRVKAKKSTKVFLVVPMRSVLFQSAINVKILKRKTKDLGKEIHFITKDKGGIYFANKCNIPVYENIGEKGDTIREADLDSVRSFNRGRPTKSDKEKVSIADLTNKGEKVPMADKMHGFLHKVWKKRTKKKQTRSMVAGAPNRTMLFSLVTGSLFILFLIAYIALPNATLELKPNSVPIEQAVNITLADADKNEDLLRTRPTRVIASYPANPGILEKTLTYNSTGNDPSGSNATGFIIITNEADRDWPLVSKTRFQTDDGLVFRSQAFVGVPAAGPDGPGTLRIEVVADEADANNAPQGARGNITQGAKMFLPGLSETTRESIYAHAESNFDGGVTSKDRIVTQRDLDGAKDFAQKELLQDVPQLLQEYVSKVNSEQNLNLTLLNDAKAIEVGEVEILLDESILDQKMNEFTVTFRVEASGISFDRSEFIEILKEQIEIRKSPDKELTVVDEEGITYRVIRSGEDSGIVDITATITGVEQYELSIDTQSGIRLIKKIKDHVAGMSVAEAERYIENLPEIESVAIKTWPFWAPTIPSVAENIKVEINAPK